MLSTRQIDLEHARALSQTAMANMASYGVPPNPRNYAIWFAHAAGTVPDLGRALEAIFAGGGLWSDDAAATLFRTYIEPSSEADAARLLGQALSTEIKAVLHSITEAGVHTRSYGEALSVVTGEIERDPDAKIMKAVVRELASATRMMGARARSLELELERASGEVEQLRRKNEAIRREAITDALTSLGNRKLFDDRLAEAARLSAEDGSGLCVVLGDVDHFKMFNDTWGHNTGDQVLKLVAGCFSDNIKGRDTAARYGGEEFAVILPNTSLDNALKLAEQIRRNVQSKKIVKLSTNETLGSISISVGVVQVRPGETVLEIMERADQCLYAAKHAGRNRVISETQLAPVVLKPTGT